MRKMEIFKCKFACDVIYKRLSKGYRFARHTVCLCCYPTLPLLLPSPCYPLFLAQFNALFVEVFAMQISHSLF